MSNGSVATPVSKKDADHVFYELTRSICPKCRRVIDAMIVLRDNKVFMRKRKANIQRRKYAVNQEGKTASRQTACISMSVGISS